MNRRNKDIFRRGRKIQHGRPGSGPILYFMSREIRSTASWPLLFALQEAAVSERPLLVVSCFDPEGYEVTARNTFFFKEGIIQVMKGLKKSNIGFELHQGNQLKILPALIHHYDAHSIIIDFDPLEHGVKLKERLKKASTAPVYEVDGHNIIPAWIASPKKEYGAYTLRPKITRLLPDYLTEYPAINQQQSLWLPQISAESKIAAEDIRPELFNRDIPVIQWLPPGQDGAEKTAQHFLTDKLCRYNDQRNNPCSRSQSELSPYFHFGHISSQQVALMIQHSSAPQAAKDAFLEEMIIRKELSDNFCLYEPDYQNFNGFHEWAQKTLDEHRNDVREYTYSFDQFDHGKTHEILWNTCQTELKTTGKLHGYLRMYWAKKILEWSESPETALQTAIILNDRYALDGRDPNGYTGIAWSIGGIHDRAWQERSVFGKIRYMNVNGCKRKFDVKQYINMYAPKQPGLFA